MNLDSIETSIVFKLIIMINSCEDLFLPVRFWNVFRGFFFTSKRFQEICADLILQI